MVVGSLLAMLWSELRVLLLSGVKFDDKTSWVNLFRARKPICELSKELNV